MPRYSRAFVALALLGATSDSQDRVTRVISQRPIEPGRWSLVLERSIQPAEGTSDELLDPGDLAITDDGVVAVVEPKPSHVKIFGPAGKFVRRVGREGSGPGEFRSGFIAIRADTLVVQDPSEGRAVMFNWRTGNLIAGLPTARNHFYPIGIDASGHAVARTIASRKKTPLAHQSFVRFSLNGTRAETVWVNERRPSAEGKAWLVREKDAVRMSVPVPLQPSAQYAVDPAGTFVTGWTGEYLLRTTRNGQDTAMLFGRRYSPVPVRGADKAALVARAMATTRANHPDVPATALRAAFDANLIPDRRPAFESIHIDAAGRRWVRLSTADTSSVMFDVFAVDGRWLDSVRIAASDWPREAWRPVAFSRTHAAVIVNDDDDRPMVRVYRIVRK